jgi:threonine dehydrogenase-like Zn-dependent dehydrogenase
MYSIVVRSTRRGLQHLYDGFIPTMEKGDILGHEFMREVVEVGSSVKNLKAGDRVVVPFTIACGNVFSANASSGQPAITVIPMLPWLRQCTAFLAQACWAIHT